MRHSRQPVRTVSSSVRAHRARKYNTSAARLDDPTAASTAAAIEVSPTPMPAYDPAYEPSWRRTGRSSMAADVRIPSFLIPCSAGQLMDARYKSRQFSRVAASDAKAISPAA